MLHTHTHTLSNTEKTGDIASCTLTADWRVAVCSDWFCSQSHALQQQRGKSVSSWTLIGYTLWFWNKRKPVIWHLRACVWGDGMSWRSTLSDDATAYISVGFKIIKSFTEDPHTSQHLTHRHTHSEQGSRLIWQRCWLIEEWWRESLLVSFKPGFFFSAEKHQWPNGLAGLTVASSCLTIQQNWNTCSRLHHLFIQF